jgi:Glycine cleavage H-protein
VRRPEALRPASEKVREPRSPPPVVVRSPPRARPAVEIAGGGTDNEAASVVEVNEALAQRPEQVNQDLYGAGWPIVVAMADPKKLDALISAADCEAHLETAGGH